MRPIVVDEESRSLAQRCALIRTTRRNRKRYPEACVTLMKDEREALEKADAERKLHAAVVYGPSVSSESQRIYYLVRWLGE